VKKPKPDHEEEEEGISLLGSLFFHFSASFFCLKGRILGQSGEVPRW
jgi:hypothetical protein